MTIDMYTKVVLTVIAAGLIALVAQNGLKPAYALGDGCGSTLGNPCYIVSVRCPPPNGYICDALVSTIGSGHLGALYGGKAEEAALAG